MIDARSGGTFSGVLDALNRIIDLAVPEDWQDGGTLVIPGHGRVADESDVVEYRDMVTIVRDRIQDMIGEEDDARAGQGGAAHVRVRRPLRLDDGPVDDGHVRGSGLPGSDARGSSPMIARIDS